MLRRDIAALLKKIGAILFVVWIAGLAPLIYINVFAASHFVPTYRIAIFEPPHRRAINLPTSVEARVVQQLKQRFMGQQSTIEAAPLPVIITQLQSTLAHSCFFGSMVPLVSLPQTGRINLTAGLPAEPAWLALPDPPPRLL